MNALGLTFHHLGLAVSRSDATIAFLSQLDYVIGPTIFDPLQNVRLTMCTHPTDPFVEIISPDQDGSKGPVNAMIQKNPLGLVYHSCYTTTNLENTLAQAKVLGLEVFCVSPPKPAVLFEGRKVSFYRLKGMGLIEIIEPT